MSAINITLWLYLFIGIYLLLNTDTGLKFIDWTIDITQQHCHNVDEWYTAYCERSLTDESDYQDRNRQSHRSGNRFYSTEGSEQGRKDLYGSHQGTRHAYSDF